MPEARDDCAVGDRNIPSTSGPTSSQRNISPLSTPETRPAEISNSSQFDATPKWPNHQLVLEPSISMMISPEYISQHNISPLLTAPQKVRDNLSERAGLGMDVIILKETTLESSFQSSHFLERIAHLILELTVDGRVVGKANLLSRKHTPGTWDADQILILREKEKKFTLSVFVDLGAEDRQLLGVMELFGQNLFDKLGERPEIPLMSDIDMVLKTSVEARSSSTLNHGVPQFKTMSRIEDDECLALSSSKVNDY
ncbi:hypothetical protein FRC17_005359 [Serendipita sp. 399]|nr:hypothetical protein FRC17_005359 [Serendipita sp. 399]